MAANGRKTIPVEDLKVGMFVERLCSSWLSHPFLVGPKRITSQDLVDRIKASGIREIIIDTTKGADAGQDPPGNVETDLREEGDPPRSGASAGAETLSSLPSPLAKELPFREEVETARVVRKEAQTVVTGVLHDIRMGRSVEGGKAVQVVNHMIDSIFRNRDAIASLTQIKGHDEYTFVHSVNVCVLALTLGRHLEFGRADLQALGIGTLLHDTGKMKIPLSILNKPGKLTGDEFAEMKKHPLLGAEILRGAAGIPEEARLVVQRHHERNDGSGYPYGLTGREIGVFGQIAGMADVYDAITSDRCYSKAVAPFEGIRKIFDMGGRVFDMELVQKLVQCIGIYPVGTVVQLDTEEIGIVTHVNRCQLLKPRVLLVFRDSVRPYADPVEADLADPSNGDGTARRSIRRPLKPQSFRIDVERYLPGLKASA